MTAAHQWKQTPEEYRRILLGLYWRGLRAGVRKRLQEISMETVQKSTAILALLTFAVVITTLAHPPGPPDVASSLVMVAQSRSHAQEDASYRIDDLSRYVDAQDASIKDRLSAVESAMLDQRKITTQMNDRQIVMQATSELILKIAAALLGIISLYIVPKLSKIFAVFFGK